MSGFWQHLWLTLRLNFRSWQPVVYGYLVPVFFLVAFGSVFRSGRPLLLGQMGQLLTITVLGGACFGMPTALVAERERGVWRRYRLLPGGIGSLVISTMIARFILVGSAAVMQILLARLIYGTFLPSHPLQLLGAFALVAFALEALGLVIAALAENVPAVQALGQVVFLPMIMIGGVGVPLGMLPSWAQQLAGFFPGRYAVRAMQVCYRGSGIGIAGFDMLALLIIGAAACITGAKLFRWDSGRSVNRTAPAWVIVALLGWVAVGIAQTMRDEQFSSITFEGLPADDDIVTPFAAKMNDRGGAQKQRLGEFIEELKTWPGGRVEPPRQAIRNLVCVAVLADVGQDPLEGQMAHAVYDQLVEQFDEEELKRGLAWIIQKPAQGMVVMSAPELGFSGTVNEDVMRDRSLLYAKKFLGKFVGKLP